MQAAGAPFPGAHAHAHALVHAPPQIGGGGVAIVFMVLVFIALLFGLPGIIGAVQFAVSRVHKWHFTCVRLNGAPPPQVAIHVPSRMRSIHAQMTPQHGPPSFIILRPLPHTAQVLADAAKDLPLLYILAFMVLLSAAGAAQVIAAALIELVRLFRPQQAQHPPHQPHQQPHA